MSSRSPSPIQFPSETDGELLGKFATAGDEDAFRGIVSRHAGLVKSVAFRVSMDPGLAEEVAQNVFALLARKAGEVAGHPHLMGWLHRCTVHEALRRRRTEQRHHRKLRACALTQTSAVTPGIWPVEGADTGSEAIPLLHESIQRLREQDRRVLILRFMEGLSYAAIAGQTGKSEEAVKKRTARALERLRTLMTRRGPAVSALTTASTAMISQALAVLPAALPGKAASHALSAAALKSAKALTWKTLTLHSIALMKTSTLTATAAVLLLCGTLFVWQETGIAAARRELGELERRQAALLAAEISARSHAPGAVSVAGSVPAPTTGPSPASPADSGETEIEQVAKGLEDSRREGLRSPVLEESIQRVRRLDAASLVRLLGEIPALKGGARRQTEVRNQLFAKLCELDGQAALRLLPEMAHSRNGGDFSASHGGWSVNSSVFTALSTLYRADPEASLAAFTKLRASGILEGKGIRSTASRDVYGPYVAGLFMVRPEKAREIYPELDQAGKDEALIYILASKDPQTQAFVRGEVAKQDPVTRPVSYARMMIDAFKTGGLDAAGQLLRSFHLDPALAAQAARAFAGSPQFIRANDGTALSAGLEWLKREVAPEELGTVGGRFLGTVVAPRKAGIPDSVSDETLRMEAFRAFDWGPARDQAIATFFKEKQASGDIGPAIGLAAEITDPALRMETLQRLSRRFASLADDFQKAVSESPALTPEEKSKAILP